MTVDREALLRMIPPEPDRSEYKTGAPTTERVQVYHEAGAGKPKIISLPYGEKDVIQQKAEELGFDSMSEMCREAVIVTARKLGLVRRSSEEIAARAMAEQRGQNPDEMAAFLGFSEPAYDPTLEKLKRYSGLSYSRAQRWALRVLWDERGE